MSRDTPNVLGRSTGAVSYHQPSAPLPPEIKGPDQAALPAQHVPFAEIIPYLSDRPLRRPEPRR